MVPDRRRDIRNEAAVLAACRIRGVAHRARLTNVSRYGCCAELQRNPAVPGERVLLRLSELLVLPATVRWVDERLAGLEFVNPMHGALLGRFATHRRRREVLH
jgi:hypothetical protein